MISVEISHGIVIIYIIGIIFYESCGEVCLLYIQYFIIQRKNPREMLYSENNLHSISKEEFRWIP